MRGHPRVIVVVWFDCLFAVDNQKLNWRESITEDTPFTDEWDAVVCCFFIDTAHNVIEYLERIYHILKPGGLWINFGQSVATYYAYMYIHCVYSEVQSLYK